MVQGRYIQLVCTALCPGVDRDAEGVSAPKDSEVHCKIVMEVSGGSANG